MKLHMLQRQIPWVEEEIGYKLNCNNIHSPKVFKDIMRTPNFGKKKYYMLKGFILLVSLLLCIPTK